MKYSKLSIPDWRGALLSDCSDWKIPYSDMDTSLRAKEQIGKSIKSFGFAVVTNVPVVGVSTTVAEAVFKKEIMKIGCPVSQSSKLDFLGYVTNLGGDISDPQNRGYESAAELPFHSDRCDLLTLLCVRQAPVGGETRLVSAFTAYHELSRSKSELAQVLCQPVPFDLRDTSSSVPWAMMPVFSFDNETFVTRYVRRFIEASQRFDDAPRITDEQRAAFDALDEILEAPGTAINLRLEPGEWLFVDNHRLLHARTEFTDSDNPGEARLLLRSWLCWTYSPELPLSFTPTFGRTTAGSYRGGVWPEDKPLANMPSDIESAYHVLGNLMS